MMRRTFEVVAVLLAVLAPAHLPAQALRSVDWSAQEPEILKHFRALVQIDSSNPPGRERGVVEYLESVLQAEGIPFTRYAKDPNRPNLVARLRGNGSKRPLLMLAHTDVVPVQRDRWPVDPFGAVVQDGYVWGRGTTDDKDKLAAMLMTLLLVKRSGVALDRDLIFLAEAAEEADTTGVGIAFMVAEHFDAIDAEFAVTEGPGATLDGDRVTTLQVVTSEKVPRRARLVATGTAGHGSVPRLDNTVTHLAAAVAKVGAWQTPKRLNAVTRRYIETLASVATGERAALYRAVLGADSAAAEQQLAQVDPSTYAVLRTTVVPTMLTAGVAQNVIPSTAEAVIDIRALPDEDVPALLSAMTTVIGDPQVAVVPIPATRAPTPPSSTETEFYRAIERAAGQVYPGSRPTPSMMNAATDMAQLRAKGVQAYGVGPAMAPEAWAQNAWHSDVERLSTRALYDFVRFVHTAVTDTVSAK